ncbi:MAG: inorganic phosphate transporter [Flavobacteriaceae bacterium]|nr:inorganic phosphate transporter [Flavobacteriaceae bacterium]
MENLYLIMIIALAGLAIADLVVGVSNDAVNFLNSAIGSKAVSFKTLMIVASIGVTVGAVFSSGLMEVARKGIFNPEQFVFSEIMVIFMAVMITDILLLDFFNTLGLPTSTTVSIVFELLGAAVAVSLIKIMAADGSFFDLIQYINTSKATEIILGIGLSVIFAFSIGAVVQWISRLLLSYNFLERARWVGALFGGIALTAITYFIFMKGLKGTPFAAERFDLLGGERIIDFLEQQVLVIVAISFLIWSILSYMVMAIFRMNIYTLIIIVGTFALALAFAGNDLVNFIGVPIAALDAFQRWSESGISPDQFSMAALSGKVETPTLLLIISGLIMVITLWFSSKAKAVVKTSIDLSSQSDIKERFEPNWLSRGMVRLAVGMNYMANYILPKPWIRTIDNRFKVPPATIAKIDAPAFDLVRAAVNLMVASVLISIATSMKLPLSTTYVTFMVAMGTSLADRAWGVESAVYRVAGVLNVIGGWFFTAIIAFLASATIASLIHWNEYVMFPLLLVLAVILLIRSYSVHRKQLKDAVAEDRLQKAESRSIQGVIHESADNISNVVNRGNRIYTNAIRGLALQDLTLLKRGRKQVDKLSDEIDDLRDNIFYFIKNLDESSVTASNFYLHILDYLTDLSQSLDFIARASYKHVNNNHKRLKFSQIRELKEIDDLLEGFFLETENAFESRSFEQIYDVLKRREEIFDFVQDKIQRQVERTRTEESSPKNTTLYFSILLETKDLLNAAFDLLTEYYKSHDSRVEPATIPQDEEEDV